MTPRTKPAKVRISQRALIQRIRRVLAKDRILRTVRPGRSVAPRDQGALGQFYLLDTNRNVVVEHHVDLEALARKLGVIEAWEELATPKGRSAK